MHVTFDCVNKVQVVDCEDCDCANVCVCLYCVPAMLQTELAYY